MIRNVTDYGARGDGKTDDTGAIQKAIDDCSQAGGGKVVFPPAKVFICGPFQIKSNVNLVIEANSVIKASTDESLYTESAFKNNYSEGSLWISGKNARNISITGNGTIDGQGTYFMLNEEATHYNYKIVKNIDMRPHLMTLIDCHHITIRDVTFRNAAYWCIHPVGCSDIVIDGIRIYNSLKVQNCDGIDIDHSKNVRISNCFIESADDCICLKSRREYAEYGATENVTVNGCTLISTSCSIKLGSENVSGIRNIVFNSIIITASNRGLGIQNRDEGLIENVKFSNIIIESRLFADVWWGKSEPIYITAFHRSKDEINRFKPLEKRKIGLIRNIQFYNISSTSENGIFINGIKESQPQDIIFDNVKLFINKWTKYPGGFYDCRPCEGRGIIREKTAGFFIKESDEITIRNCSVKWGENRPGYYGAALYADRVDHLWLDNLEGKAAHPHIEDIVQV